MDNKIETKFQCYYEESGIRCPERQIDYWCSEDHKTKYQAANYKQQNYEKIGSTKKLEEKLKKEYIDLGTMSYIRWMPKVFWDRYKPLLVYQYKAWVPKREYLSQIFQLNKEMAAWDAEKLKQFMIGKQLILSLDKKEQGIE